MITTIENKNFNEILRLGLLPKVYVWSVLLEPLLFFVVTQQGISGVGGNISRLLQLIVILGLFFRFLTNSWSSVKIPNPFFYQYKWYFYYLNFIIFSCIYGFFNGYYSVDFFSDNQSLEQSGFSAFINSQYTRPFFEFFISIYYFVYFTILPRYIINSKEGIDYFLKIFLFTFYLSLLVGVIDYLLVVTIGYEWIPRHLSDFTHVGARFHGLAGEPRDAFVYLGFGMGMLFLKDIWLNEEKTTSLILASFLICMMLTQSSSGFIGLIIATGLIFVYKIPTIPVRYLFSVFLIISIGSVATYFTVTNSYRTMLYINAIPDALIAFQNSSELPSLIQAQIVNIYPIWLRFTEIINLNFLPTILGTGLGTASLANSIFFDGYGVHNPFANIIRVVFEAGMIGTLLFINAFLRPITTMVKNREVKEKITIFMLFILGLNFGHRSATVFIFLGMLLLIFNYKKEFVR